MNNSRKTLSLRRLAAASAAAMMAGTAVAAPAKPPVSPVIDQSSWTQEQRQVFASVNRDMQEAGIGMPAHYFPFPQQAAENGFYSYASDTLVGMARQGGSRNWAAEAAHVTGIACAANKTGSPAFYERERTEVFLHETAHRIATKLGLMAPVEKYIKDRKLEPAIEKTLLTNAGERYAEVTATLYILSNLKNPDPQVAGNYDLEAVHGLRDKNHDTFTSVDHAVRAFRAHPHHGLSIVDAAKWAARVMQVEAPYLGREYILNREAGEVFVSPDMLWGHPTGLGASLMGIPQSHLEDIDARMVKIENAERDLCTASTAAPLLPSRLRGTPAPRP